VASDSRKVAGGTDDPCTVMQAINRSGHERRFDRTRFSNLHARRVRSFLHNAEVVRANARHRRKNGPAAVRYVVNVQLQNRLLADRGCMPRLSAQTSREDNP
jgi:hypothetical protein